VLAVGINKNLLLKWLETYDEVGFFSSIVPRLFFLSGAYFLKKNLFIFTFTDSKNPIKKNLWVQILCSDKWKGYKRWNKVMEARTYCQAL